MIPAEKDTSADVSGTVISTSAATRTAHAKGVEEAVLPIPFGKYSIYGLSFRPSVLRCQSVTTFSAATRNETAKKRYQRVQCHTGFI